MNIIRLFFVVVLVSGCSTVPNTNNNPNSGGLSGVILGELRGDYDAREQERMDRLERLKEIQRNVEYERQLREKQKTNQLNNLSREETKLWDLQSETKILNYRVINLQAKNQKIDNQKNALLRKIHSLETEIEETQALNNYTAIRKRHDLEQQLNERMREYELLRKRNDLLFR